MATVTNQSGVVVFKRDIDFEPPPIVHERLGTPKEKLVRPINISPRHWRRRYLLWSKFDQGIQMDPEAWFEVTPENIAEYIAHRSISKTVIHDCCCGVGGNSIQFALKGLNVQAVDLNAARLEMLRRNALIYGVSDSIRPINRDVFDYLHAQPESRACDQVFFMSPPWGGEVSNTKSVISVDDLPINLRRILPLALAKFGACILHLPKQFLLEDIFSILHMEGVYYVEVESIYYAKPVRHLKCHLVYVESPHTARSSLLIGPWHYGMRYLFPFVQRDRFSPIYANALLKMHYFGRYVLRSLDTIRGKKGFANGIQDLRSPVNKDQTKLFWE